jgi:PHP family Zn ribbon phosphoesterase
LPGQNDEDAFGVQVVVDEDDMVEDLDDRLLIGATTLSAERVAKLIGSEGGLTIASHVDRSGFGIFAQLGFIPPGLRLDALEFSRRTTAEAVKTRYRQAHAYPLITSSDAHCPEEIGAAYTVFFLNEARVEDIRSALHGHAERRVVAYGPSG